MQDSAINVLFGGVFQALWGEIRHAMKYDSNTIADTAFTYKPIRFCYLTFLFATKKFIFAKKTKKNAKKRHGNVV